MYDNTFLIFNLYHKPKVIQLYFKMSRVPKLSGEGPWKKKNCLYECLYKRIYTPPIIHMITNIVLFYNFVDVKILTLWLIYLKTPWVYYLVDQLFFFSDVNKNLPLNFVIIPLRTHTFLLVLLPFTPSVSSESPVLRKNEYIQISINRSPNFRICVFTSKTRKCIVYFSDVKDRPPAVIGTCHPYG